MSPTDQQILIVDDEADVVHMLTDFFHDVQKGCSVASVGSGDDALAAIHQSRPDLVLLDIHMPGMGGLEVLKQLKTIDRTIPVIMVTGSRDVGEASDALAHGAFAYIPKPFDFRYIDHLVTAALEQQRPAKA